MKRKFSMGQALEAPFSLVKRRPVAVFVWGLAHLLFALAILAAMAPMLTTLGRAMAGMDVDGAASDAFTAEMIRFQAIVQGLNLLQFVFGVILFNAVMRAVWAKRGDGFAFIRIGMDELRVLVTAVALVIGLYLGIIVLALIGVALGAALWSANEMITVPVMVGYGVIVVLGSIWLVVRAVTILPVSVMDKTFAFGRGWAISKGQSVKLLLTAILSWIIMVAISVVFLVVLAAAVWGVGAAMGVEWSAIGDLLYQVHQGPAEGLPGIWMEMQPLIQPLWPVLAVALIPYVFFIGLSLAFYSAPLASAAQQLIDSERPKVTIDPLDDGLSPIAPVAAAAVAGVGVAAAAAATAADAGEPVQAHEPATEDHLAEDHASAPVADADHAVGAAVEAPHEAAAHGEAHVEASHPVEAPHADVEPVEGGYQDAHHEEVHETAPQGEAHAEAPHAVDAPHVEAAAVETPHDAAPHEETHHDEPPHADGAHVEAVPEPAGSAEGASHGVGAENHAADDHAEGGHAAEGHAEDGHEAHADGAADAHAEEAHGVAPTGAETQDADAHDEKAHDGESHGDGAEHHADPEPPTKPEDPQGH